MAKLHRKELKQDEVREKIAETVKGLRVHGRELMYVITIVIAVLFITLAWWYYEKRQQEQSQMLLGTALEKMQAPVGQTPPPDQGLPPAYQYKTDSEKYSAALKDLEVIIQKYGNTPAAETARCEAGVAAYYLNDYPKAERYLKQSTNVSDRKVSYYISRMTLADFYSKSGKPDQAISLLKEAIEKNKDFVPPETLLMQMADTYEKAGKTQDAIATYNKVVQDFNDSPAKYQAEKKLEELKGK